ncbi:conserved Plasmodium protein, unknown function [Plasmodium sp. gorilla clade G2]|uniref:conserved Plasmodium protein, unknown function n=1 Tax=Plasmodium sp. gorilla clade G2 TaxID=880535 RepID=UPI000D2062C6|nr:conserved Plasmodium protein, unknown function [Plasmodium sp. gorilla clade G2]SOV16741.1 conserved Plasmodium protein, unknown function [Plasmodium sp. gorilla clade G2]
MNFFKKKKNDSINKRNAFIQNSMITKNKNDNIKNDDIFKDKNAVLLKHEERNLEKEGKNYSRKELEESVNSFLDNSYKENVRTYSENKIEINKSNTDKILKIDNNNNNNNMHDEIKEYMHNSCNSDYGMENYNEHMKNQHISKNISDSSIIHSKETSVTLLNNQIENSIKKKESKHNHTIGHNNNKSYITNNDNIILNTQNNFKSKNTVDNSLQHSDKINIVKDNKNDNITNDIYNYYNSRTSLKKNENKYNQSDFIENKYNSINDRDMSTLKFSTKYSHKDIHIINKNDTTSYKDTNLSGEKDIYVKEKEEDVKQMNHLNESIEFKKNNRHINKTHILNSSNIYDTEENEKQRCHNNIGQLINSRNSNTNYLNSVNNINDTNKTNQIDNISINNNLNTYQFNESRGNITYSNSNINEKSNFYKDSKNNNIYSEYHNNVLNGSQLNIDISNKNIHINNNSSFIQAKNKKNSRIHNSQLEEIDELKTNHLDDLIKNEVNQNTHIKNKNDFINKRNSMIDSKMYLNNISQNMYQSKNSNTSDWSIKQSVNNQNISYRNDKSINRTSINNIITNDNTMEIHNLEHTHDKIINNVDTYTKEHQNDITNSNMKYSLQNVLDNSISYNNNNNNNNNSDDSKKENFHLSNSSTSQKNDSHEIIHNNNFSHEIIHNNNFSHANNNLINSTNSDIELLLNDLSESSNSLLNSQIKSQLCNSKHFLTSQKVDNSKFSYLLESNQNINEELNNDIGKYTEEISEQNNDITYKKYNENSLPFNNYKTKNMEHIKYDYVIEKNNHHLNKSENLPRTKSIIDNNYIKYKTCVYKEEENMKRKEQREEKLIESGQANLLYEFERGIKKNMKNIKKEEMYKYDMLENLSNKNMKYVNDINKDNNVNHHNNDVNNNYYYKEKKINEGILKDNNSSGSLSNISHFTQENNFTYHKKETQNSSNNNNNNNNSNMSNDHFNYYTNNEEHNNDSLDFSIHREDNINILNNNNNSQQNLQEYDLENSGNVNVSSINKSKGQLDKNINYMKKLTMNNNYVNTDLQISYMENELQKKIKDFDKSLGTIFEDKCNLILNRIEKLLSYEWFNDDQ